MTSPHRLYPDVERVLVNLLEMFVDSPERVGTATPADLQSMLPFVRVVRIPGGGDDRVTDLAAVDVDVYASTRSQARRLSEDIRNWLTARWRRGLDGVVIDQVINEVGPHERPWDNHEIRRYGCSYTVGCRRAPAQAS